MYKMLFLLGSNVLAAYSILNCQYLMPVQLIKLERERERESHVAKAEGQIQTSNHSRSSSITLRQKDAEPDLI